MFSIQLINLNVSFLDSILTYMLWFLLSLVLVIFLLFKSLQIVIVLFLTAWHLETCTTTHIWYAYVMLYKSASWWISGYFYRFFFILLDEKWQKQFNKTKPFLFISQQSYSKCREKACTKLVWHWEFMH